MKVERNTKFAVGIEDKELDMLDNLIKKEARRISNSISGNHYDDLLGAGYLGLASAMSRYSSNPGCKFTTYAWHRIVGEMQDYLRKAAIRIRSFKGVSFCSLNEAYGVEGRKEKLEIDCIDYVDYVDYLLSCLAGRDKEIMERVYRKEETRITVGKSLNITGDRVGQIIYKCLRKIRNLRYEVV